MILEFFPEAFFESPWMIPEESIFACDLVVNPIYQGSELGFELASYALRFAEESGAPGVYAQIMNRTPIRKICEQLEFRPLLRLGPAYKNGEAMLYVGCQLRK